MTQGYDTAKLKVGMEIHVELATRSKMWTAVANLAHPDFHHAEPNTLTDPVVIGMPGVLPVMNERAVEMSMRVGLALGCQIAKRAKWDRKSYYYPDLPKNYQISQYDLPLVGEGSIMIPLGEEEGGGEKTIRITRAHLEEDAGKLLHEAPGGRPIDYSIVDLNRAGTPLLEIVTEPDFTSAAQAVTFGQMLRDLCRHLGVSEGIMQMGHIRFEPNINVEITRGHETVATPIAEIKNLNSFKAVYGAIQYEYQRQIQAWLETGQTMAARTKQTRGWDDVREVTVLQREKEDADEYRYFPDPDLCEVVVDTAWLDRLKADMPEMPWDRRKRYVAEFGLLEVDARTLTDEPGTTRLFEATLAAGAPGKKAAALLLNEGLKQANAKGLSLEQLGIEPTQIAGILNLLDADKLSSHGAAELFELCCGPEHRGVDVAKLAEAKSLLQVSDTGALDALIDQVLADPKNEKAVMDIRSGKDKAVGALIGQIMKLSKGQANPKMITELIKQRLQ